MSNNPISLVADIYECCVFRFGIGYENLICAVNKCQGCHHVCQFFSITVPLVVGSVHDNKLKMNNFPMRLIDYKSFIFDLAPPERSHLYLYFSMMKPLPSAL